MNLRFGKNFFQKNAFFCIFSPPYGFWAPKRGEIRKINEFEEKKNPGEPG